VVSGRVWFYDGDVDFIREADCIVMRHLESYLYTKRALGGGWCKVVYGGVRLKCVGGWCAGGVR